VVTHSLARVTGRRNETCVGSEPVGTLKSADVAHGHQELGPEDRSHARQASEDPSLGTGEKTLPKLLVEGADALLEAEDVFGELGKIEAATSCAGRVTLWALAAARAFCATLLDPLTPRDLR
jgi:hypothetical protein